MADAQILSEQYSEQLIPSTVIELVIATFGVFGNGLVLLMYTKYIEDKTGGRYFIPILAFVDLLGSVSNISHFHLDNTRHYTYPGVFLCKTLTFVIGLTAGFSSHLILAIALQRYLIICRPLGQRMTPKVCRIVISVTFLISVGYASPILKFKTISYKLKSLNITGNVSFCRTDDSTTNSTAVIAYLVSMLLISFINIFMTCIFYIPVIKTIYKRLSPARQDQTNNVPDGTSHIASMEIEMASVEKKSITQQPLSVNEEPNNISRNARSSEQNARKNISVMFLVIIIVFEVSYLTSLVTHIYEFASTEEIKGYIRNIYVLCKRFQLLNHIANPYIYLFYDLRFRNELRRVCCGNNFKR